MATSENMANPAGYAGSAQSVYTRDSDPEAIKAQMNANSQAWHMADEAERERLHKENEYLASLLPGSVSFNPTTGTWSGSAAGSQAPSNTASQAATAQTMPSGYTGSSQNVGTNTSNQDAIKAQMNANSIAWYGASAEEQARLHAENEYLASLLGGSVSFDPTTGYWSGNAQSPATQLPATPQLSSNQFNYTPAATNYNLATPDYKPLLDELKKAAEDQNNAKVDYAVQQAVTELERALADSQNQFKEQQESVSRDEMQSRDNAALYAEARGDKGGIGEEQYSSIMNTAAQNRLTIQQAQTKLATDTQRQIADLRAQGEFEKADGLLEIAQTYLSQLLSMEQWAAEYGLSAAQFQENIRQWEAQFQLAVAQYNTGLEQWAAEYDLSKAQLQESIRQWEQEFNANQELAKAELIGSFSDGTQTLAAKNQTTSQLASLGESLLNMGIMPTAEQLTAMGMTQSQAQEAINVVKLQQAAKTVSSSSGSNGSGSGGDEVETGSRYDDLFAAAMESGYPKSFIANNYKQYGFTSSTGVYDEYRVWAEEYEGNASSSKALKYADLSEAAKRIADYIDSDMTTNYAHAAALIKQLSDPAEQEYLLRMAESLSK